MKSTKKTTKLKYGQADLLPPDVFNKRDTKFRVTMLIDLDLLEEIRNRAKNEGLPYQTYINHFLRKTHLGNEEDSKIRRIVREELLKTGT